MQGRVHDVCGYLSIHRLQLLQQRHNLLEPHRMHLQHHPRVRHEQRHSCRLRGRCVYLLARSNACTHAHQAYQPMSSTAAAAQITPNTGLMYVSLGTAANLRGWVDELKFYDHALSAQEVQLLYAASASNDLPIASIGFDSSRSSRCCEFYRRLTTLSCPLRRGAQATLRTCPSRRRRRFKWKARVLTSGSPTPAIPARS